MEQVYSYGTQEMLKHASKSLKFRKRNGIFYSESVCGSKLEERLPSTNHNVLNAPGVVPGRYDTDATNAKMDPVDKTNPDKEMVR